MAGLGDNVLLPSSITFIINVVMTIPALIWVDRVGRRPTLLIGAFLMMTCLLVNGSLFTVYGKTPEKNRFSSDAESMLISGIPSKVIIACTYLFVASFATTWGPVSWIYPSELCESFTPRE